MTFLLEKYPKLFDDVEIEENMKEFPQSPIILAVRGPYGQNIGRNLILQLLLEHEVGNIDMSDSKGT